MIYAYLIISAALIPILNNFFPILKQDNSYWLVPLLFVCFFVGLVLIQLAAFLIMILTSNIKRPNGKKNPIFHFLVKHSLPIILFLARVKINVKLAKDLPDGRFLLVCNHQHDFDPVIILNTFCQTEIGFIGKKEIYTEMPFVAKAMHRLNSLPIDREHDRVAANTIIKAINFIKNDVTSIALFPEGYTSLTCELLPCRNGSFKIATKANVPIVVCVINNTRALPKNIFRKRCEIEFRLLDVITPEQYADMTTTELGNIIHNQMQTTLDEIRNK